MNRERDGAGGGEEALSSCCHDNKTSTAAMVTPHRHTHIHKDVAMKCIVEDGVAKQSETEVKA